MRDSTDSLSLNSLDCPTYDPVALLDFLRDKLPARNDSDVARKLGTYSALISKVRNKKHPLSAAMLLRIHDVTGIGIKELKEAAGLPAYVARKIPVEDLI